MKYEIQPVDLGKSTDRKVKIYTLKQDDKKSKIAAVNKLDSEEKNTLFTSFKKKQNGDENYLYTKEGLQFRVFEEKKFYQRIKGYVPIGQNLYVGIAKFNMLFVIIPLILTLLLGLFSFCGRGPEKNNTPSWDPTIDQNIGDENTTVPLNSTGKIKIAGFSEWYVPSGKTDKLSINLKNPDGNPCYFSFSIVLADTNETIYQSDMVPPGESIKKISITHELSPGEYPAYINISTYALEDGNPMNSATLNLNITVS